mmetsp:Transcript_19121/g.40496  ORF Transcript_19121/g.40496 Transcript_19121/m.40496 type:complete len:649 (+) Transcript_19121:133-2079(+)
MADVQELLVELEAKLRDQSHAEALAICDRILAISPTDADVLRAKLALHTELGSYAEALALLDSLPDLSALCGFERAYFLYQLNRESEALEVLQSLSASAGEQQHLLLAAQVHYRMGAHAEAAKLFMQAAEQAPPSAELSTNVLAALVAAGKSEEAVAYAKTLPESTQFELYYNRACAAIELGELRSAKLLLDAALKSCRESLSTDEFTEEEIEVELGVLTAQAAYVDQQRGDTEAASQAYEALFSFKTELEPAVAAVAANNIVALRGGERDLFDSWKKCRANFAENVTRKLTPTQRRAFLFNGALLSMHMSRTQQCKELLATLNEEFPQSADTAIIQAATAMRAKQQAAAEQILAAAAERTNDPRPALTIAQLQLQAKQPELAAKTLEGIEALRSKPAMIGARVALYERLGDVDAAAAALASADDDITILQAAGEFHARHGRWQEAADAQRRLLELNPRDLQALAALVIATSHFDPAAANEHLARLEIASPPIDETALDALDPEQLEQSLPRSAKSLQRDADVRKRDAGEQDSSTRLKKKRRTRKKVIYPKGFDPANPGPPPDPERWLPKRERSNYRPRRKDKRGISRGPQGSTSGQARPDARTTTNVKALTEEERLKAKQQEEAKARSEAAAAAAASKNKKGKKGKR